MCAVRAHVRHREMLIKYRAFHIQHIQKNLEMMNIKLCRVLKDITGVTGMKIIRAIIAGERDTVKLARFRDPRCFSSEEDIAKSLEGNYKPEHMFALSQAVLLFDDYTGYVKSCDRKARNGVKLISPDGYGLRSRPCTPRQRPRGAPASSGGADFLFVICRICLSLG